MPRYGAGWAAKCLSLSSWSVDLPPSDLEMATGAGKSCSKKQGLKFRFKTVAESAVVEGGRVSLHGKRRSERTEEADKVLVCVGRRPVTDGLVWTDSA